MKILETFFLPGKKKHDMRSSSILYTRYYVSLCVYNKESRVVLLGICARSQAVVVISARERERENERMGDGLIEEGSLSRRGEVEGGGGGGRRKGRRRILFSLCPKAFFSEGGKGESAAHF